MEELVGEELIEEKLGEELDRLEGVKGLETVECASECAMYTLGCFGVVGCDVLPPPKNVDVDRREWPREAERLDALLSTKARDEEEMGRCSIGGG